MMLINIKMMTEEAFATLKKNYKDVYEQILNHPSDSTWLNDYLGFEPYKTKEYEIEDFELKDSEDYKTVALENSITIYEAFKDLPRYVLCNNRFWAWVTFEKAYKQAQHTVKLNKAEIIRDYWLIGTARRSLMLGAISRHYFQVEISIDESVEDKYYLTKSLTETQGAEMYRALAYRNIGMLKQVSLAFLKCALDGYEKYGQIIFTRDGLREIMKDASRIGSVMLIDDLDKDEIYSILYKKLENRISKGIY